MNRALVGAWRVALTFFVFSFFVTATAEPKLLTRQGMLRSPPARIVSLAPNLTEILYAIGAGGQVAGVSEQCDFPVEARAKPKIGSFVLPNLERVLVLAPDLVVATEGNNRDAVNRIAGRFPVLEVNPRRVGEIAGSVRAIAERTGHQAEGNALAVRIEQGLAALRKGVPAQRSILLVLQIDPIISVSNATWLGDVFREAGFRNVLADSKLPYPVVSEEFLVAHPPEVVFAAQEVDVRSLAARFSKLPGAKALAAATVVSLPADIFLRPGPRVTDAFAFLLEYKSGRIAAGRAGGASAPSKMAP